MCYFDLKPQINYSSTVNSAQRFEVCGHITPQMIDSKKRSGGPLNEVKTILYQPQYFKCLLRYSPAY